MKILMSLLQTKTRRTCKMREHQLLLGQGRSPGTPCCRIHKARLPTPLQLMPRLPGQRPQVLPALPPRLCSHKARPNLASAKRKATEQRPIRQQPRRSM